jgi:hypothetical protein
MLDGRVIERNRLLVHTTALQRQHDRAMRHGRIVTRRSVETADLPANKSFGGPTSSGNRLDIETAGQMLRRLPHHSRDRARRYARRTDVRYRQAGHGDWHDGRTENISRTGVLIRARHLIAPQTPIEVQLVLPPELGGYAGAPVIGRGRVVRAEPPTDPDTNATVAAFIAEYVATSVADNDPRRI